MSKQKNSNYKRNDKGELVIDWEELLRPREVKSVIVTERNKPNLDRMAEAFYDLLYADKYGRRK